LVIDAFGLRMRGRFARSLQTSKTVFIARHSEKAHLLGERQTAALTRPLNHPEKAGFCRTGRIGAKLLKAAASFTRFSPTWADRAGFRP